MFCGSPYFQDVRKGHKLPYVVINDCPNLSDVVKALRKFTHKDVPFQWNGSHDKALVESNKLIAQGPLLCHFSPRLALILQVDVFRVGVGEVFLQNDQPVVFDSNILQAIKQCISHSHF